MASVATAGAAAAMVICVDKEPRGDGPICINHLHEVRECEARGDGDACPLPLDHGYHILIVKKYTVKNIKYQRESIKSNI
jgi:hypothetical protein